MHTFTSPGVELITENSGDEQAAGLLLEIAPHSQTGSRVETRGSDQTLLRWAPALQPNQSGEFIGRYILAISAWFH